MSERASSSWDGAILCGGTSRRMGRDKALLVVEGEPMVLRVARALHRAGARRIVAVGGDQTGIAAALQPLASGVDTPAGDSGVALGPPSVASASVDAQAGGSGVTPGGPSVASGAAGAEAGSGVAAGGPSVASGAGGTLGREETAATSRPEVGVVPDQAPGEGPLGGIVTALAATGGPVVLVVACDLVAPSPTAMAATVDALAAPAADLAAPMRGTQTEWLHAAWRGRVRKPLVARFAAGERAIHRAVTEARLTVVPVFGIDPANLADADTPSDIPR